MRARRGVGSRFRQEIAAPSTTTTQPNSLSGENHGCPAAPHAALMKLVPSPSQASSAARDSRLGRGPPVSVAEIRSTCVLRWSCEASGGKSAMAI